MSLKRAATAIQLQRVARELRMVARLERSCCRGSKLSDVGGRLENVLALGQHVRRHMSGRPSLLKSAASTPIEKRLVWPVALAMDSVNVPLQLLM